MLKPVRVVDYGWDTNSALTKESLGIHAVGFECPALDKPHPLVRRASLDRHSRVVRMRGDIFPAQRAATAE